MTATVYEGCQMGSCFFIGHRETPDRVYPTLIETIERHIAEYGVSEFVVGQYGNFDRLVIRALSQVKRAHPDITLMLMTPYYPVNRKVDLPKAFDALFYPCLLYTSCPASRKPDLAAGICLSAPAETHQPGGAQHFRTEGTDL